MSAYRNLIKARDKLEIWACDQYNEFPEFSRRRRAATVPEQNHILNHKTKM